MKGKLRHFQTDKGCGSLPFVDSPPGNAGGSENERALDGDSATQEMKKLGKGNHMGKFKPDYYYFLVCNPICPPFSI